MGRQRCGPKEEWEFAYFINGTAHLPDAPYLRVDEKVVIVVMVTDIML